MKTINEQMKWSQLFLRYLKNKSMLNNTTEAINNICEDDTIK